MGSISRFLILLLFECGTLLCDYVPDEPSFFISSDGRREMFCVVNDVTATPTTRRECSGLDCCFDDDGNFMRRRCPLRKFKRILGKWFDRVPEPFKNGMDADQFISTYGLGEQRLQGIRDLALGVRREVANLFNKTFNPNVGNPEIFEDQLLSESILRRWQDVLGNSNRQKRNVLSDPDNLWPKVLGAWPNERRIGFDFDFTWFQSSSTISLIETVYQAMKVWEKHTCYRFYHVSELPFFDPCDPPQGYLLFTRQYEGCWSTVGYQGSQAHLVNLNCSGLGTFTHELGHAIGAWHQHMRPDRDEYVYIDEDNIIEGKESQFTKLDDTIVDTLGVPYDYSSIMHYRKSGFGIGGAVTIVTLDPAFADNMGQRVWGPTFFDVKVINLKGCLDPQPVQTPKYPEFKVPMEDLVESSGGTCLNTGYPDYATGNSCVCPWGLAGTYCDGISPSSQVCTGAGIIEVDLGDSDCIEFRGPGLDGAECTWLFKHGVGSKEITLWFEDFDLFACASTFLEIRTTNRRFPWYCDDNTPPQMTTDNQFLVHFRSRSAGFTTTGFRMCWSKQFGVSGVGG